MNHRICGADELSVIILSEPKVLGGKIAQKNVNARVHEFRELRKFHMKLQRVPQAAPRFLWVARSNQHVQRLSMSGQEICRNMGADVAGRASQKNRHVFRL